MPSEGVPDRFPAYRVEVDGTRASSSLVELPIESLPAGDVTVRVAWSSLNYKDALSARGRPGVTRNYPHTPGIDAAGTVVDSRDPAFPPGARVIVTSYDLGVDTPGGFGELIRVPSDWVVPLPDGLSSREAMILGTAGLTAGLARLQLETIGLTPRSGEVVVTGASGGVGSLAVAILAGAGYQVVASTGTKSAHGLLEELGAGRIIDRSLLAEPSDRPLLKGTFAGGIDTVGSHTLANLLKSTRHGGAVAACGLVQGSDLPLSVFPFILRGVSLLGVDSANCPSARRRRVWERLAGEWRPDGLDRVAREVGLGELDAEIDAMLAGRSVGRVLVRVAGE